MVTQNSCSDLFLNMLLFIFIFISLKNKSHMKISLCNFFSISLSLSLSLYLILILQTDGFETEFEVVTDENGKYKAVNITSADGSLCPGSELNKKSKRSKKTTDENSGDVLEQVNDNDAANEVDKDDTTGAPKRKTRNQRRSKKRNSENNKDVKKPHPWEQDLEENVQVAMKSKGIEVDGGRAFLSIGDARMKLGTDKYAALAHTEAILAEGKWTVEPNGIVSVTWERVLNLVDNEWALSNIVDVAGFLLNEVNLSDGTCIQCSILG